MQSCALFMSGVHGYVTVQAVVFCMLLYCFLGDVIVMVYFPLTHVMGAV